MEVHEGVHLVELKEGGLKDPHDAKPFESRSGTERRLRPTERRDQQQLVSDTGAHGSRELVSDQDRGIATRGGGTGLEILERAAQQVFAKVRDLPDPLGIDTANLHGHDLAGR